MVLKVQTMGTDIKALKKSLAKAIRQWSKVDKSAVSFVAPYRHAHRDVEPVPVANIATVLGPKLDKVLADGSRLCVIGYDGAALAKKGYPWRRKISKWLMWGCSVDYFMYEPGPGVVKALSQITKHIPSDAGRLRIFRPKKKNLSPKQQSQIEELKTFHFAVSENPLTLWIEANHQTSEPRALDCYFFPENAATETGLGQQYLSRFNKLIRDVSVEVPFSR